MERELIFDEIKEFLESRFDLKFDFDDLDFDTDLFEFGYIDSLESLVIINFLEKKFKIKISPDDLIEFPINSLNEMTEYVLKITEA